MKLRVLLSLVSAFLFAFQSMTAHADKQNYPGSMCKRTNTSQPYAMITSGEYVNPQHIPSHVDCPIVRTDFNEGSHHAGIESSWLDAVDDNTQTNVCARLFKHLKFDRYEDLQSTPQNCTKGHGNDGQVIRFGNFFIGSDYYALYFSAFIPAAEYIAMTGEDLRSSIVAYHVEQ